MSLTTQEISEAQDILTNEGAAAFYAYLSSKGETYGDTGQSVTNNDGPQGELANGFAASGDDDDAVDVSYGSPAWIAMNAALAQAHVDAYTENNGGSPTWEQIQDYHNDIYDDFGLDADDWLPNRLLNESTDPAQAWADLLSSDASSTLRTMIEVLEAGGSLLAGPYLLYEAITNPGSLTPEELAFAKNLANAIFGLSPEAWGDIAAELGLPTDLPNWLRDNSFPLPTGLFELPPWLQDVLGLLDDGANSLTPLVLDLDGDGVELVALNDTGSAYWDIDQDGFAEASSWITGGDGLLAIDLNEDGFINDHSELFGSQSGSPNGFTTLATYDSNTDGYITSADTQFSDLLVWVDTNADGYSQDTELYTLNELSITSISLGYSNVNYSIAGNAIEQESTFTMNGNTRTIVDAWFAYDDANTVYAQDYTLDIRTLFLPTLRGYGELPSLHIAMSLDEDLLELVKDFVTEYDLSEVITFAADPFNGPIQEIMFKWAGVDEVEPDSRGDFIDARVLEFLEALTGEGFIHANGGGTPNPGPNAGPFIWQAWASAYNAIALRLIHQAHDVSEIFGDDLSYNPVTDAFEGVSSLDLEVIENQIFASEEWSDQVNVARFLVSVIAEAIGIENLSEPDYGDLQALMPEGLTIEMLENALIGAGILTGDTEDNLIIAGYDSDVPSGYDGNDVLIGGSGTDTLYGGGGNDTYVWNIGDGDDSITDIAGTDVLRFGEGITTNDLRFVVGGSYTLEIYVGSEKITLSDQVYDDAFSSNYIDEIETAVFSDTSTLSLVNNLTLTGTSSSETIYGLNDNNILNGLGGDDTLYGYSGNDTLQGGAGNDIIDGGDGTDAVSYATAAAGATINLYSSTASDGDGGTDTLTSIENAIGSTHSDTLIGNSSNNTLNGGNGTDTVSYAYASGAVTVNLSTGSATGDGTDTLASIENVIGSAYADTLTGDAANNIFVGGAGNDSITGGDGTDTVDYSAVGGAVTANLTTGSATGEGTDTLATIENLIGSAYGDTLTGDSNANTLTGNDGTDTLYGNAGADTIYGGAGVDTIQGNAGNDTLYGDAGADSIIGFEDNDTIYGGDDGDTLYGDYNSLDESLYAYSGADTIYGGAGNDQVRGGKGNDVLYGDAGADTLHGGSGDDVLEGGDDNDTLYGDGGTTYTGYSGNDILKGGAGTDSLHGQDGNDTLWAGDGADTLNGGTGTNTFNIYNKAGNDNDMAFVNDWNTGTNNKIDISDILEGYTGTGLSNFVQIAVGSHTTIQVDRDGTGTTYSWDNVLRLQNITSFETNVATLETKRGAYYRVNADGSLKQR